MSGKSKVAISVRYFQKLQSMDDISTVILLSSSQLVIIGVDCQKIK
ncbi:hypothetical protein [Acinetobacter bereziniae]|nr:hypothetical protein ACINWC743_1934 [Acinetobacter sp. WC-743]CEI54305.1 hypothetical protein [Acinetobacter bereziniae]